MHYVHQDGQAVYKFAVRKMVEAAETVLTRNGVTSADLGCFIATRPIAASSPALRPPRPSDDKVISTSTASATPPAAPFPLLWKPPPGRPSQKGRLILIASVGAGFTVAQPDALGNLIRGKP